MKMPVAMFSATALKSASLPRGASFARLLSVTSPLLIDTSFAPGIGRTRPALRLINHEGRVKVNQKGSARSAPCPSIGHGSEGDRRRKRALTSFLDIYPVTRYYNYMLEDAARKYGLLALLIALLFVICFSENGVIDYIKLKQRIGAVDASINTLQSENIVLKGQIERLQHDDRYLEDVARKKFGFIREGEKVYRIEK